jgi:hypothetical protein
VTSSSSHGVNEVVCRVRPDITPAEWFSIMSDASQRLAWIDDGIAFATEFLATKRSDPVPGSSNSSSIPNSNDTEERNSQQIPE